VSPRYQNVVGQVTKGLTEKEARAALLVLQKLQDGAAAWTLPE
ncbi:MAG: hypothetical protein K0R17_3113, partial [Rariglobus sp.]|nr:hypothetical protein [Rariglobus sp.]